ncbi:MAG: exodeoxyribonuclease VII large subunit [Pontiellaceae bacterium]|nr:exodeoxyribonuclease VII large subunit [Pontiellaceae bacterium]
MSDKRRVYSVAEVNRKARMVLESGIGEVWVEGELSRVTIHSSGHWYFTLKDESAAVSCMMFRKDNVRVSFRPKDGMKVQLFARPSLYESGGRYQLIASAIEEAGKGNLQEQFEKLKAKLAAEGLFDAERKKPLPLLPRRIGVVTSPTGAAVRDIIQVLTRRFPNIQVLLAPVKVQGEGAAKSIAAAIDYLNKVGQASRLTRGKRDACTTFFNPHLPLEIHARNLPHWTQEGMTYFVTFRLADSIPAAKLRQWSNDREIWMKDHDEPYSDEEKNEYHRLFSEKIQGWLDAGMGSCLLKKPAVAKLVGDALMKFDGDRYDLGEWVVMPNHVHLLVTPRSGYTLSDLLHSWKSYTAHEIAKLEGVDGAVWQHESYDHIVRSPEQLVHFENYIHENPGRAGVKVEQASRLQCVSGEGKRDACSTLPLDVLIVGRGGGSIEDLWAFNEEVVARAIARSEIPVISAVGHEIDFTISDFTADVRAPTPSAAAELAVREKSELVEAVARCDRQLRQALRAMVQEFRLRLNRQAHSYVFREPENLVRQYRQRLRSLETRMGDLLKLGVQQGNRRIENAHVRAVHALEGAVQQRYQRVDECSVLMRHRMERKAERERYRLERIQGQLRMLNPLAVLGRGYSLTRRPDGSVVRSATVLASGDTIITQFADGQVESDVHGK